jgi:hypothetical protein
MRWFAVLFVLLATFAGAEDRWPDSELATGVFNNGGRACPFGTYQNAIIRVEHGAITGSLPVGTQVQGQSTGATGWINDDDGTGSGNGFFLQAVRGTFLSGEAVCQAPATCANTATLSSTPVEVGVYACESSAGFAADTHVTSEVILSFPRASATDEPDISKALEQQWYYCHDNPLRDTAILGFSGVSGGCQVRLEPGMYELNTSSVWRRRLTADASAPARTGYTFDGGGSFIYWNPTSSVTEVAKASLPTCNEAAYGTVRRLDDGCSLDDTGGETCVGALTTATSISSVRAADDADATECDAAANNGNCDFGSADGYTESTTLAGVARVFTVSSNHGFSDGKPTASTAGEQGDLITIAGASDTDCNGNWLVKDVVDADEFIATPNSTSGTTMQVCDNVTSATVELAETIVWCNGHTWVNGWPGIVIGGKSISGTGAISEIEIKNLHMTTSSTFNRLVGLRLDGYYGSGNDGGVTNFDVNIKGGSVSGAYGQILLDLGSAYPSGVVNDHVMQDGHIRVECDYWGQSHEACLRFLQGKNVNGELHGRHGGAFWFGVPDATNKQPHNFEFFVSIEGFDDGPGLKVLNGIGAFRGHISGDADASLGGPDRGLGAILGTNGSSPTLDFSDFGWLPNTATNTNECFVYVNDVDISGLNGRINLVGKRTGEASDPKRAVFCANTTSTIRRLVFYGGNVPTEPSGGVGPSDSDYFVEKTAVTYDDGSLVCPWCVSPGDTSGVHTSLGALGLTRGTAPTVGNCLQNQWQYYSAGPFNDQTCDPAGTNTPTTQLPLLGGELGRPWFHAVTCVNPLNETWSTASGATEWDNGDSLGLTLEVTATDGAGEEAIETFTISETASSQSPNESYIINAAPVTTTDQDLFYRLKVASVTDASADNGYRIGCYPTASRLVPF